MKGLILTSLLLFVISSSATEHVTITKIDWQEQAKFYEVEQFFKQLEIEKRINILSKVPNRFKTKTDYNGDKKEDNIFAQVYLNQVTLQKLIDDKMITSSAIVVFTTLGDNQSDDLETQEVLTEAIIGSSTYTIARMMLNADTDEAKMYSIITSSIAQSIIEKIDGKERDSSPIVFSYKFNTKIPIIISLRYEM